ncbi:MAG: hypothetical protein AB8G14_10775 [Ilumatobacter sp.]
MAEDSTAVSSGEGPQPEFHIVVRHPGKRGPLGPYRLIMVVAVVLLVFGSTLWSMISTGNPDDGVLLRAGIVGLIVWITSGVVDSALAAADSATPLNDDRH